MQPMDEVYREYARVVFGFLLTRTRNEDLAEELTQETFFQAIRSSDRFDESCKVSTWLCGIAKNVLLTYKRKHPENEQLDEALASEEFQKSAPSGPSAEHEALDNLGRLELMKRLHALPEPAREVMYLRVFGGLSFSEIGEIHGKSENWARVTFFRAKEKLRKDVER